MSVVQGTQIPVEILGGLVTNIDPQALPPGVSPDCADVIFKPGVPGTVQTRPGKVLLHTFPGSADLTYMATYIDQQSNKRKLYLDTLGNLWQEFPQDTYTNLSDEQTPLDYAKSDTAFASEFIAFSDGKFGKDIPRRYTASTEQNTYDRLSQVGPGLAPTVNDFISSLTIEAPATGLIPLDATISSISQVGDVVTAVVVASDFVHSKIGDQISVAGNGDGYDGTFAISQIISDTSISFVNLTTGLPASSGGTLHSGMVVVNTTTAFAPIPNTGQLVIVAGATDPTYDGTFAIRFVSGPSYFVYNFANSGTNSGDGTLTVSGQISAGTHKISLLFITRNGYFTAPAPPNSWVASGSNAALVFNIALGPPNVLARLLVVTTAGGENFFFSQSNQIDISTFLIPDNTTTSWIIDFTDLALLSSESADLFFDRIELSEVAGLLQFADRIAAWGARNRVENFVNMSFDGGVISLGGYPLGWLQDGTFGAGGATEDSTIFGFDYTIQSAAPGLYGLIYQPAWQDYLGVSILSPLKNYGFRVRLKSDNPAATGVVGIDIYSPGGGGILAVGSVNLLTLTSKFQEFIVPMNLELPATIPEDTILRVYLNTASAAVKVWIKNIEVYPLDQPFLTSTLFVSNAADPEAFQGVTGFINVNENDGFRLVSCGIIRDRLYITKNIAGLYTTTDDPANEPSGWTLDTISRRMGAETINSIGAKIGLVGEDWVFMITRDGLYNFWASEPPKISQEIQPTWNQINWDFAYTMWICVDIAERRVLIGAPFGSAQTPNKILQMDYKTCGETAETVAAGMPVGPSSDGQQRARANARKWSIWNIAARSCATLERDDGNAPVQISGPALYKLDESQLTDDGVAIPGGGYYLTAFYPSDSQDANLQIKGNRVLQRYVTLSVAGVGNLTIEAFGPGFVSFYQVPIIGAPEIALALPSEKDTESYFNFGAERISNKITATGATPWWSMQNFNMYIGQDPTMVIRGNN